MKQQTHAEHMDADELAAKKHSLMELLQFARGGMAKSMKDRHAGQPPPHPPDEIAHAADSMQETGEHNHYAQKGEEDVPHDLEDHHLAGGGSGHGPRSLEDQEKDVDTEKEDPTIPGVEASEDPAYEAEEKREGLEDGPMAPHHVASSTGGPMGGHGQHSPEVLKALAERLRAKHGKR